MTQEQILELLKNNKMKLHIHYDPRSDISNVCLVSRDKDNRRVSIQIGSIKANDRPTYHRNSDKFTGAKDPALEKDPAVRNIFQEIKRLLYTVLNRKYIFCERHEKNDNFDYNAINEALPEEYKAMIKDEEQKLTESYKETLQRALNIRKDLSFSEQYTALFFEQIYQIAQNIK